MAQNIFQKNRFLQNKQTNKNDYLHPMLIIKGFHGAFKFAIIMSNALAKLCKPLMILTFHASSQAFNPHKVMKCVMEFNGRLFTCWPVVEFHLL